MNGFLLLCLVPAFLSASGLGNPGSGIKRKTGKTEWILSELPVNASTGTRISGTPEVIDCKYGKALFFDGSGDGIFLDLMPLEGLGQFTIEAIICPMSGGNTEQRFLHLGEINGDRVLLELRSTLAGWYFDAYIKSEDQQKTLVDPILLHPADQWYHVAFVIGPGKQETYINGKKELESLIETVPMHGGKTSIGVRQNEQSWFKGAIYKIRISPKALKPGKFMHFK